MNDDAEEIISDPVREIAFKAHFWTRVAPWFFMPPVFCAGIAACYIDGVLPFALPMIGIWAAWLVWGLFQK